MNYVDVNPGKKIAGILSNNRKNSTRKGLGIVMAIALNIGSVTIVGAQNTPTADDPINTFGGAIMLNDAVSMTTKYRDKFNGFTTGHLFGKEILVQVLEQPGVEGIRFYHAFSGGSKLDLIMVGVKPSNRDIISGIIAGSPRQCPGFCGGTSMLNDCEPAYGESGNMTNGPVESAGTLLTLADASMMTANFRMLFRDQVLGHLFGRDIIKQILQEPGVEGIRFYNGLDDNGELVLVMVGVNANGIDLTSGTIADLSTPCPPFGNCDKNQLTSSGQ